MRVDIKLAARMTELAYDPEKQLGVQNWNRKYMGSESPFPGAAPQHEPPSRESVTQIR